VVLAAAYIAQASVMALDGVCVEHESCDSSVGIVLGYGLDDSGFDSWRGLGIFFFATMSGMALGPPKPPIQWVPGALSLGLKQLGCEADHSLPSSAEIKE
jgi:hypothetical protein